VKRPPSILAEAESELVAGFHTEYSGIRWSYFFMAEYGSMFAVSGIATALFLGGGKRGWDRRCSVHRRVSASRAKTRCSQGFAVGNYIANLFGCLVFLTKGCVLVFVQMWVRWTLPRLRIDRGDGDVPQVLVADQLLSVSGGGAVALGCFQITKDAKDPKSGRHRPLLPESLGGVPLGNKAYLRPFSERLRWRQTE